MFGMKHDRGGWDGHWAAARWARGRHGHHGWGGRHGIGGGDMPRFGRMLGSGDLQLIALSLIAEQPRHGYEIIKLLEEKTSGAYSPSPGLVYPTLTYLEEADYVTAEAQGAKKLYTITDAGRSHLADNREYVDALLTRFAAVGEKVARMRRHFEGSDDGGDALPRSVRGAFQDLSEAVREVLAKDKGAKSRIIEAIDGLAESLRKS